MLAALLLAACGGSQEPSASSPTQASPPPAAPAPDEAPPEKEPSPPGEEAPDGSDEATGGARPPGPEDQLGGAGDAEGALVPAVFALASDATLSPRVVRVPEFLGIELSVSSSDDRAHRVTLRTDPPVAVRVPAGGSVTRQVEGQRAGDVTVLVDGRRAGSLDVGFEAGP
ncbi:MAG TPA: hypothetical protein VGV36_00465 [Solirubrobacteraceae bacterium]|nr:hypothetical protein [Solirubrobacteraceae bacterium]